MKNENLHSTETELYREYRNLRGMSLSGDPCPTRRFAYAMNMYVDHEGGGDAVESIPGFRKIHSFGDNIHSAVIQSARKEKFMLIHAGEELYRLAVSKMDESSPTVISELSDCKSYAFAFGSVAIITDGTRLLAINDKGEVSVISEEKFITGCTVCALYDGRIFMSGNPDFPGQIFYSSPLCEDEISFDKARSLTVKAEGAQILSLLSFGGRLWVFKSADAGDGSILSYREESGELYLCRTFSGPCPTGQVCYADGKIVFLTNDGLFAIERPLCDERAFIKRLSRDMDPRLLREDINNATITLWRGYIAVGCGESIYLCDTEGEEGYDWYIISGVGGYENDRRVYRYLNSAEEGYFVHRLTDKPAESEVFSIITEDKRRIFYTEENKKKYAVYPTEQFEGGDFLPAKELISDGTLLWFYSDTGRLYVFNSDKRGVAPESVRGNPGFDEEEYKRLYGGKIHPEFYSFDGHAPSYLLLTHPDGCGITDLCKSSDGNSLTLRLKDMLGKSLCVDVITDGRKPTRQVLALFSLASSAPLGAEKFARIARKHSLCERAPLWQEKQICLHTEEFGSPFGLCRMSFRYKAKDKIKKG